MKNKKCFKLCILKSAQGKNIEDMYSLETAFIGLYPVCSYAKLTSLSTYWKDLSLARLFDPKIAEEIGTKVFAQKYELRNSRKILRGLGTLELAICSCFIRGRFAYALSAVSN